MSQFMQMMQYVATHFQPPTTLTAKDPESKMAQALKQLQLNLTQVPAGLDDRCENLHKARFYGGAVGLLQDKWLKARELLGLERVTPLASYDFDLFVRHAQSCQSQLHSGQGRPHCGHQRKFQRAEGVFTNELLHRKLSLLL